MPVATLTEPQFEAEVLRAELPVLLAFFTEWSAPWKAVAPELDAAATDLDGKAILFKVDLEKAPRIAAALRVQAVPAFVAFLQGRPVAAKNGPLKRRQIADLLEPFLPRPEGAVKPPELAQLMKEGQVVPVDTREATSFARAHIPGAQNFPLADVKSRLAELHMLQGAPVFYCRTGKESRELADELAQDGMNAAFLEGGFLAWEAESLPIERPD